MTEAIEFLKAFGMWYAANVVLFALLILGFMSYQKFKTMNRGNFDGFWGPLVFLIYLLVVLVFSVLWPYSLFQIAKNAKD